MAGILPRFSAAHATASVPTRLHTPPSPSLCAPRRCWRPIMRCPSQPLPSRRRPGCTPLPSTPTRGRGSGLTGATRGTCSPASMHPRWGCMCCNNTRCFRACRQTWTWATMSARCSRRGIAYSCVAPAVRQDGVRHME
ncbi:hypothetical protein K438DRAFT_2023199 [Mycena galopus ATCC 62051]|nr:hypothetical protein K438DRAFT_2023199 [Mycena galopus ATCC 62051]